MNHTMATPSATATSPEARSWLSGICGSISAMRFKTEGASAYTSPSMIRKNAIPVRKSDMVTGAMWLKARDTLSRIADLGEREGVTFVLENLNTAVDHPKTPFARAADTMALVAAVGRPSLKLNLDLYHAQIDQGDLTETCRRALPHLGKIQMADVPGRCEPGTGEINYRHIARALDQMGYRGTIALEGWARTDSHTAITTFIETFSNLERTDGGLR